MVTRTREVLQYRESRDPKVSVTRIEVRTGWKWKAKEVVDVAESRLSQRLLVGLVAQGRAGLGSRTSSGYGKDEVRAPF